MHVSASEAASNCLSWLGDSIMHIMTTEAMTLAYPQHSIGLLSPVRNHLLSRAHLARCALSTPHPAAHRTAPGKGGARAPLLAPARALPGR